MFHIFRKASFVADALAKISHTFTVPQVYFDVQDIPRSTRALYYLDKVEMATFKIRRLKMIKEPA